MHECLESMCVVDVRSDPIGECCGVVYVLRKCELPHYDVCGHAAADDRLSHSLRFRSNRSKATKCDGSSLATAA